MAPESHGALATDTTGSGVAMPKMHPLWLHFHDPSLEASFQSWHGTTWPNQAFEIIDLLLVSTFTLVPLILFTQWRLGNPLSYRPLLFVVPILVRFFFKTRPHLSQVLRWYVNFSLERAISCMLVGGLMPSSHGDFLSTISFASLQDHSTTSLYFSDFHCIRDHLV